MLRVLAGLLLLALLWVPAGTAQELDIPSVSIAGNDLPNVIELAPADADAFRRRLNKPPRLEETPFVTGTPYEVRTTYWTSAIRLERDEEEDGVTVSTSGDYYPEGGYVRVTLDGKAAWMVLNLRQRAILGRYIQFAQEGLIEESPSTMDVLAVAATREAISVQAGGADVPLETSTALLAGLADANPAPGLHAREPARGEDGYWLVVTLLEGRSLRYYVDGTTVTEFLGTERYDGAAVAELLRELRPASVPTIQHDEAVGSVLWWPVMIGGGLAAIAAAVWLRRLIADRPA